MERGHLRRPPAGAPKTVTFCSIHLHNVVAKKCDAATSFFQRLYAHIKLFDVDFVGGDFHKAVKEPEADVFSYAEFMAPGSSPLWGAGGLEGDNADCMGFLCMPQGPFHWFINKHGGPHVLQRSIGPQKAKRKHTLPSLYAPLGNIPLGWHPSCPSKRRRTIEQQRTSASANDSGTKPHLTRQTRQLIQPQRESCGLPHPRTQSITAFSSDASLSEVLVPGNSKGLAPHGANFGSLVAPPPVPPHCRRHGIMVGANVRAFQLKNIRGSRSFSDSGKDRQ